MNTKSPRPFLLRLRLAPERDQRVVSAVAMLLAPRRPATIPRFIVPVVVDPVDRMIRARSTAHIREERRERRTPALTDGNTSPAVTVEPIALWIQASLLQRLPGPVFLGVVQPHEVAR